MRRQLELLLEPSAVGESVDATRSSWGEDRELLKIGDTVSFFDLPSPDGTRFALDEWLGKKNIIIITTYRAHW